MIWMKPFNLRRSQEHKYKTKATMEKQLYSLVCAQAGQTLSSDENPTKDTKNKRIIRIIKNNNKSKY